MCGEACLEGGEGKAAGAPPWRPGSQPEVQLEGGAPGTELDAPALHIVM